MHSSTAVTLLKYLAKLELLEVVETTFQVPNYPAPIHRNDVMDAFRAIGDAAGLKKNDKKIRFFWFASHLQIWCYEKIFEKIFKIVFIDEKLFPVRRTEMVEGDGGRLPTLPSLFIGNEKTQVKQIPLIETPPWPFKFLLELGGMIVCRPQDPKAFLGELKQFINNHPQCEMKVHAEQWEDKSIVVVTTWFAILPQKQRKKNLNVPDRSA